MKAKCCTSLEVLIFVEFEGCQVFLSLLLVAAAAGTYICNQELPIVIGKHFDTANGQSCHVTVSCRDLAAIFVYAEQNNAPHAVTDDKIIRLHDRCGAAHILHVHATQWPHGRQIPSFKGVAIMHYLDKSRGLRLQPEDRYLLVSSLDENDPPEQLMQWRGSHV